jgi:gluconolactonase
MRRELLLLALVACSDEETQNRTRPPNVDGREDASFPSNDSGSIDGATQNDAGANAPVVHPNPLEGRPTTATKVVGGFDFTEGPVWIGGRLLFTDIPNNVIQELLPDGGVSPFRNDTGGANGLAVDPQGRLWMCQGAVNSKRVTRQDGTKGATVSDVTTMYNGSAYNAPNDIVVRKDGNAYFTDPNYSGQADTQNARAVYRIAPNGDVTRLAGTFSQPNGIALSPDGSTLYVVDNQTGKLVSATVNPDGTVGTFADLGSVPGGDGMAVDDAGNLYVTASAGVLVFDKAGKSLGIITAAEAPANCTFGGPDRKTLYITARTSLYRIDLNVPGLP